MEPEIIFKLCNAIALSGWIILLFISPFWWTADRFIQGVIIVLLAIVYTWLIALSFHPEDMNYFSSLEGVMELFKNKYMVTAGWVHYLAFDLFTGTWIRKDAVKRNISHWQIIPSLLLTFMLGPLGLLSYLGIRWMKTKKYFND